MDPPSPTLLVNSAILSGGPGIPGALAGIPFCVKRCQKGPRGWGPRRQPLPARRLLRGLEAAPPAQRAAFFADVRRCRRRPARDPLGSPLAAALGTPTEYRLLPRRALQSRVRGLIAARALWPHDAFRVFDAGRGCPTVSAAKGPGYGLFWIHLLGDTRTRSHMHHTHTHTQTDI